MGAHKIGNTFLVWQVAAYHKAQVLEWMLVSQATLLIFSTGVANVV